MKSVIALVTFRSDARSTLSSKPWMNSARPIDQRRHIAVEAEEARIGRRGRGGLLHPGEIA
jgi:hypothetical protein